LRRGLTEEDFEKVAHFFDRAVAITENINAKTGPKVSYSVLSFEHPLICYWIGNNSAHVL